MVEQTLRERRVVLVLAKQRLVVLEVPKTASMALRRMIKPHADGKLSRRAPRHIGIAAFNRHHRAVLEARLGGPVQTMAVVRAPLERLQSWYRYRARDKVSGLRISTEEVTFEAFIEGYLSVQPPAYAKIGRQDRFVGWDGARAQVDHLFDFADLDAAVRFLVLRLEAALSLDQYNPSGDGPADYRLNQGLRAAFEARNAGELALYAHVRGHPVLPG